MKWKKTAGLQSGAQNKDSRGALTELAYGTDSLEREEKDLWKKFLWSRS